jgi:NTP pyrophosphatase (non-canonical NTP hydrolase)
MINEIGDLMWYISQLCNETGLDLEGIIEQNIIKLRDRKTSGTLQGSGDDR